MNKYILMLLLIRIFIVGEERFKYEIGEEKNFVILDWNYKY